MKLINLQLATAIITLLMSLFCEDIFAQNTSQQPIIEGAERFDQYLSLLKDKNVAMVVNQTSTVKEGHLVDVLLKNGVQIKQLFAPEHGFRGDADAGEKVKDHKDVKTGLPIISLYGNNYKPKSKQLEGIDVLVFDIQDVGARFYTYLSTMHYVMEACAENGVEFLLLDRPNPNGYYIDGPVLDPEFASFVGLHPIPVVHGMTFAELASMIVGESWIEQAENLKWQYVLCENYDHNRRYDLPVKPSPNLPNAQAISLYPSLCLFEGTVISEGRGTDMQFQVVGHPELRDKFDFNFRPVPNEGSKMPKHNGKVCFGLDLRQVNADGKFDLSYLIQIYQSMGNKEEFFLKNHFIDNLAGTNEVREMIEQNLDLEVIELSWEADLMKFKALRKNYLHYKDFN